MMKLVTLMAAGTNMTQGVSSIPKSRRFRYVGIMPPPKNMVKVIMAVRKPLPLKLGRDRGYAAQMVRIML